MQFTFSGGFSEGSYRNCGFCDRNKFCSVPYDDAQTPSMALPPSSGLSGDWQTPWTLNPQPHFPQEGKWIFKPGSIFIILLQNFPVWFFMVVYPVLFYWALAPSWSVSIQKKSLKHSFLSLVCSLFISIYICFLFFAMYHDETLFVVACGQYIK